MKGRLFPLLFLLLAQLAVASDTKDVESELSAGSHVWLIDSGTALEISWSYVFANESVAQTVYCGRRCNGGKHPNHAACDTSCCSPCERTGHQFTLHSEASPSNSNRNFMGNLMKSLGGYSNSPQAQSVNPLVFVRDAFIRFNDNPYLETDFNLPCFNDEPCSIGSRKYGYDVYKVVVNWSLSKVQLTGGNKATKLSQGPTGQEEVGFVYVPRVTPLSDDEKIVVCKCTRIFQEQTDGSIKLGLDYKPEFSGSVPKQYANINYGFNVGAGYPLMNDEDLDEIGEAEGVNMNQMNVYLRNPLNMTALSVGFGYGLYFDPDEDDYQEMVGILRPQRFTLPAMSWEDDDVFSLTFAQTSGETPDKRGKLVPVEVLCTQMGKHPPKPGVKYHLRANNDPNLMNLAKMNSRAMMKGPWDQVRMWIYTDKTTLDKVAERLLPPPTPGMYLRSLYEVAQNTSVNFDQAPYSVCIEPRLLAGTSASEAATRWLIERLFHQDPNSVPNYLKQDTIMRERLAGDKVDEVDLKHIAHLTTALFRHRRHSMRQAALDLLTSLVPESQREAVMKAGGLAGLDSLLVGKNETLAAGAVEIAALYNYKPAVFGLWTIQQESKNETLKKRAAEVAAQLGS